MDNQLIIVFKRVTDNAGTQVAGPSIHSILCRMTLKWQLLHFGKQNNGQSAWILSLNKFN